MAFLSICDPFLPLHDSNATRKIKYIPLWQVKPAMWSPSEALLACSVPVFPKTFPHIYNTHNASSSAEVIQGEVSYNREP